MPYPVAIDPRAVRGLQRKVRSLVDDHLLWAFNPTYPSRPLSGRPQTDPLLDCAHEAPRDPAVR